MTFNRTRVRGTLAIVGLAATASLAACGEDSIDISRPDLVDAELFDTYVALGNSITAGVQSGGIVDSTQRETYVRYLFEMMGNDSAQYRYASIRFPGCTPPITNIATGALLGGVPAAPPTCALRGPATNRLNNYGVPSATVIDPTAATTPFSNTLTSLILGGKSQVSRALETDPTFVSVWIGNNDILSAAITGLVSPTNVPTTSPGITSPATFRTAFTRIVDSLRLAPRLKGGVFLGVVDVTNIPQLFSARLLQSPQVQGAINAAAGRTVAILPNCTATSETLIAFRIVQLLRDNPSLPISCEKIPGQAVAGDLFILDGTEKAAIIAAATDYNAHISAEATRANFAYLDPNPLLAAARGANQIPVFPNLAAPAAPFGSLISIDGIHPARQGHKVIANALAEVINAKYGTSLQPIAVN